MEATTQPRSVLSIALVESDDASHLILQRRLKLMGHRLAVFASVANLLAALSGGLRVDLLLLTPQDEMTSKYLSAVCKVQAIPVLLVVQDHQWDGLRESDFAQSDAIGFDLSRSNDHELGWRMHALSRRKCAVTPMRRLQVAGFMVWGDYEFLDDGRTVLYRGRQITLQPRQFALALELFRNVGRVLTRDFLWNSLWKGMPVRGDGRALDACAANLRKKLDLREDNEFVLWAVYGRGYQLVSVHAPLAAAPERLAMHEATTDDGDAGRVLQGMR